MAEISGKFARVGDLHPADLMYELGIVIVGDEDRPDFFSICLVLALEVHGATSRASRDVSLAGRCRARLEAAKCNGVTDEKVARRAHDYPD